MVKFIFNEIDFYSDCESSDENNEEQEQDEGVTVRPEFTFTDQQPDFQTDEEDIGSIDLDNKDFDEEDTDKEDTDEEEDHKTYE